MHEQKDGGWGVATTRYTQFISRDTNWPPCFFLFTLKTVEFQVKFFFFCRLPGSQTLDFILFDSERIFSGSQDDDFVLLVQLGEVETTDRITDPNLGLTPLKQWTTIQVETYFYPVDL